MSIAALRQAGFDIEGRNRAFAILTEDFSEPLEEIFRALMSIGLEAVELVRGGGGEAGLTRRLRRSLTERCKRSIRKIVDEDEKATREIDHVRRTEKGAIAPEIEWNDKDPFFDLENFQRLRAEGAASEGIIVARGASLQANMLRIARNWAEDNQVRGFDDLRGFDATPTDRQRRMVDTAQEAGRSFVEA